NASVIHHGRSEISQGCLFAVLGFFSEKRFSHSSGVQCQSEKRQHSKYYFWFGEQLQSLAGRAGRFEGSIFDGKKSCL
ncbi:MAG TPA: hypothetical protein PK825_06745, partial [Bacteroidales bacterium]|nr:hypothetical protein [Bacteroidales bacterium]